MWATIFYNSHDEKYRQPPTRPRWLRIVAIEQWRVSTLHDTLECSTNRDRAEGKFVLKIDLFRTERWPFPSRSDRWGFPCYYIHIYICFERSN